jgi:hypothetical protein
VSSNAQRMLKEDLAGADFRVGEARGDWSLVGSIDELEWPHVFTEIAAAPRVESPDKWLVRWDATGYGSGPITGGFWDAATGTFVAKDKWPKGRPGSTVATVFKTDGWLKPGEGFYHPWDRTALQGHEQQWNDARWLWTVKVTIADYVALFHRWLNSEDYLGRQ